MPMKVSEVIKLLELDDGRRSSARPARAGHGRAVVRGYMAVFEGDDASGFSAYAPDLPGVVAAADNPAPAWRARTRTCGGCVSIVVPPPILLYERRQRRRRGDTSASMRPANSSISPWTPGVNVIDTARYHSQEAGRGQR